MFNFLEDGFYQEKNYIISEIPMEKIIELYSQLVFGTKYINRWNEIRLKNELEHYPYIENNILYKRALQIYEQKESIIKLNKEINEFKLLVLRFALQNIRVFFLMVLKIFAKKGK